MHTHYIHKLTGRRIAVDEKPTREEQLYDEVFDLVWRIGQLVEGVDLDESSKLDALRDRCARLKKKYNHR